jgi:hypothetical protein
MMMPEQGGNGVCRNRPYVRRSAPRARTLILYGRRLYAMEYTYGPSGEITGQARRLAAKVPRSATLLPRSLPATRAECEDGPRPCPYVSCKHHLYLDVNKSGSIKMNFPEIEPGEMLESCALDVAARGGATLEEVGAAMSLTRERVRQVKVRAMAKMKRAGVPSLPGSED